MAVETDYIIAVAHVSSSTSTLTSSNIHKNDTTNTIFDTFRISKTYCSFRLLVQQLKQQCDQLIKEHKAKKVPALTDSENDVIKYCTMIFSMIDTQRTTYLGKVNFTYVKVLAKQRMEIINHVVSILLNECYPKSGITTSTSFSIGIANIIHTFFLTDHVVCDDKKPVAKTVETPTTMKNMAKTTTTTTEGSSNPLLWIGDAVKNVATNVVTTTQTSLQPILSGGVSFGGETKAPRSTDVTSTGDLLSVDTSSTTVHVSQHVVPMSQRNRRCMVERDIEEETLHQVAGQEAKLVIDDGLVSLTAATSSSSSSTNQRPKVPNYLQPVPTVRLSSISTFGKWVDHNPWSFLALAIVIVVALQYASKIVVDVDFDVFLLCIFGSFCIGLHTPRPMILGYDNNPSMGNTLLQPPPQQPKKVDRSGRLLLRQSMAKTSAMPTTGQPELQRLLKVDEVNSTDAAVTLNTTAMVTDEHLSMSASPATLGSPMAMFPEGAELGSHLNCWSRPDPSIFQVRGPNYLQDKKKIPSSSEYIFPCRGLDLFLTDACPQNVGNKFSNILMGGKLRDVPTLIINFRLPWGILLFYCEISTKFIPFLEASTLYGTEEYKQLVSTKLQTILNEMTPGDRTVARWCMNNSEYKNKTLKIVPVVVDGPWVVKSVVGGKPAIIGAKLPINYVYQSSDGPNQALYLEADLDIAASSAARGILSVARSYTQILTLNLGFVIQANEQDELPEQMLTGARLHGIDPLTAPSLPPVQDDILTAAQQLSSVATLTDEESE